MHNIDTKVIQLLIENNIQSLPVDIESLRIKGKTVKILTYQNDFDIIKDLSLEKWRDTCKAFTILDKDGIYVILYNASLSYGEKTLALAHELAHIALGHTTVGIVVGKSLDETIDNMQEAEAEEFALKLLAPVTILKSVGITKAEQIERVADIPLKEASYASTLLKADKTYITPQDLILLENFKPFIKKHKKAKRRQHLKLAAFALLAAIAVTAAYVSIQQFPKMRQAVTEITNEGKVFVTPTGDKFHTYNCQHVSNLKNLTKMTVAEALGKGYEQCAVCKPLDRIDSHVQGELPEQAKTR